MLLNNISQLIFEIEVLYIYFVIENPFLNFM